MSRTVAIIQARTGSARLKNKVLMDICGKPMLQRVVERVKRATTVDRVIVATDTEMHSLLFDVCYYVGSGSDVLERFYRAATYLQADVVVRITGDCPMVDPGLIDLCVASRHHNRCDYYSNVEIPTYPDGLDVEVFTFEALQKAHENARLPSEREHVGPWMRANLKTWKLVDCVNLSHHRWCVDYEEDLAFVRAVYAELGEDFDMHDVLRLLERKPELAAINAMHKRNAAYVKQVGAENGH